MPHDIKHMSSRLLFGLLSPSFSVFFMTAFRIGTFAELVPHRWFVAYFNSYETMGSAIGCSELHNACAIQGTNKRIFLRTQMAGHMERTISCRMSCDTDVLILKAMLLV